MFIEVMNWADFDIPVTKCILYSGKDYNIEKLVKQFMVERKIVNQTMDKEFGPVYPPPRIDLDFKGCYVSGIRGRDMRDYPQEFISWLKSELNFRVVVTEKVRFSD